MKALKSSQKVDTAIVLGVLLNAQQLAERLNVPVSWVREKSRERARLRDADPLPTIALGKYCRFSWPAVQAWIERQSK
jgi:hypothetical protein